MKTQIGDLVTGDFAEKTLTFEIEGDMEMQAGKYAIVPNDDYQKLSKSWISIKEKLPIPGSEVLIIRDVRKWDSKREVRVGFAKVGFFDEETEIGGPRSLTGYHKMIGIYFAVPSILHPDSVTYWQPAPDLPNYL